MAFDVLKGLRKLIPYIIYLLSHRTESSSQQIGGICGESHRGEEVSGRCGPVFGGDVLPPYHSERRQLQPQVQRSQVAQRSVRRAREVV